MKNKYILKYVIVGYNFSWFFIYIFRLSYFFVSMHADNVIDTIYRYLLFRYPYSDATNWFANVRHFKKINIKNKPLNLPLVVSRY